MDTFFVPWRYSVSWNPVLGPFILTEYIWEYCIMQHTKEKLTGREIQSCYTLINTTANTNDVMQTEAWDALHCGGKSLYMY